MRSLSAGYFLSTVNALVFAFPTLLFYPALATYPISIILRGLGWRFLRRRLGRIGLLYLAIWMLGALTYASLILSFLGVFGMGVWAALAAWVAYSVMEAALYLGAASRLKIRLLFASPVSLAGVGILVSALAMNTDFLQLTGEIRYGETTLLILGGSMCLAASALITAIAALRIGAESPEGERELETLLIARPRYSSSTSARRSETGETLRLRQPRREAAMTVTQAPAALIRLEVLSRGDSQICLKCGSSTSIGMEKCSNCGEPFRKASAGLRCPVCKAPFSIARAVAKNHYVCGQCFSDLRVVA